MLADVSIYTGYVTIALMLTGRFVFQYLGWKIAALATPVVMLLTGGAFFGLSLTASAGGSVLTPGTANVAAAGALAGAVTQVTSFSWLVLARLPNTCNISQKPCYWSFSKLALNVEQCLPFHYRCEVPMQSCLACGTDTISPWDSKCRLLVARHAKFLSAQRRAGKRVVAWR